MNTYGHKIIIVSLLAGLASLASSGQVLNGAAAGATAVRMPATPVIPPPPPPPPSVNASAAAQSAAATSAAVRAPVSSAATNAAGSTAVNGSASTGLNANATTHAAAQGQVNGLAVATEASKQASVTVNTADTVAQIQTAAFARRDEVTTEVQARLDASASAMADLEVKTAQAGEKSRAAFAKILVDVRAREKALRTSLRAAAKATKEESWGAIQSELAKNYGAYAEIVARAEASASTDAGTK
ncbi:hypothetical protein [Opitutus sp. GAS368]|jgi:hypothetical protein|uniref:hypothetical protein n=1 Tax=Opitutus sp. GAS368 TaxID=1882749 RepID=UPI00087A9082|nr:hypothetical protein [Opitutus sp. GAS368]SDS01780.1 hypothetical protein SAMN05444173_1638 [Opitutus sp. GAS368]